MDKEKQLLRFCCERLEREERGENEVTLWRLDFSIFLLTNELAKEHQTRPEEFLKIYQDMARDVVLASELSATELIQAIDSYAIDFRQISKQSFLENIRKTYHPLFVEFLDYVDEETRDGFIKRRILCDYEIYFTYSLNYMVMLDMEGYLRNKGIIPKSA